MCRTRTLRLSPRKIKSPIAQTIVRDWVLPVLWPPCYTIFGVIDRRTGSPEHHAAVLLRGHLGGSGGHPATKPPWARVIFISASRRDVSCPGLRKSAKKGRKGLALPAVDCAVLCFSVTKDGPQAKYPLRGASRNCRAARPCQGAHARYRSGPAHTSGS